MDKIEATSKESKEVNFKESFDFDLPKDRCEIVKDIVAMANSGGGRLLIGVKDDGASSEFDITLVLSIDPAKITDQIRRYTGQQFSDFEIYESQKNGKQIAILRIRGAAFMEGSVT
jgi:predicted HTH transcriptional regulator